MHRTAASASLTIFINTALIASIIMHINTIIKRMPIAPIAPNIMHMNTTNTKRICSDLA